MDRWAAADYKQLSALAAGGPEPLRGLVALYGTYYGCGPDPLVGFDVFRVDADYSVLTDYLSTETYHQHNTDAADGLDGLDGFGAAAAKWAEQGKNLLCKKVHKFIAEGEFVLTQSEGEFGGPSPTTTSSAWRRQDRRALGRHRPRPGRTAARQRPVLTCRYPIRRSEGVDRRSTNKRMSIPTYAGKTYRFSVDNGVVFHNTYSPDGTTLHYETVSGPTAGASEDVTLHAAEVAHGVVLLGWVEKSGMTVTHAMNLNTLTVHAFWTYDTPEGRTGELHVGTLEEM